MKKEIIWFPNCTGTNAVELIGINERIKRAERERGRKKMMGEKKRKKSSEGTIYRGREEKKATKKKKNDHQDECD